MFVRPAMKRFFSLKVKNGLIMMWPTRSDISVLMVWKVKLKKRVTGDGFASAAQRRGSIFHPHFEKLSGASPKYLSIFLAFSMGSFIDALLIVMNWVMNFLERSFPPSSRQHSLSIIFSHWSGKNNFRSYHTNLVSNWRQKKYFKVGCCLGFARISAKSSRNLKLSEYDDCTMVSASNFQVIISSQWLTRFLYPLFSTRSSSIS